MCSFHILNGGYSFIQIFSGRDIIESGAKKIEGEREQLKFFIEPIFIDIKIARTLSDSAIMCAIRRK